MGASSSKTARSAAGAATRKYPTRPSDATTTPQASTVPQSQLQRQGPTVNPPPTVSETRDEAINLDASDPVYASHLRSLGAVQPNPMLSNSSIAPEDGATAPRARGSQFSPQAPPANFFPDPRRNPAVTLLNRRQQLQQEAEREADDLGRPSFAGRQFLDVSTIRQILMLRDEKRKTAEEIEKMLRLRKGVVARLGPKGVVEGA